MSFRSRLSLFFVIIVVIPMAAVAVVLFRITGDSETGKTDSRIAGGLRTAFTVYEESTDRSRTALRDVSSGPGVREAIRTGKAPRIRLELRRARRRSPEVVRAAYYDSRGREVASAGGSAAVAPATAAPTTGDGKRLGTLWVSTNHAREYARRVRRLTGLHAVVLSDGARLASTIGPTVPEAQSGTVSIAGKEYRVRFSSVPQAVGPPLQVGLLEQADLKRWTNGLRDG